MPQARRGFTLVEVMMALVLLAGGVLATAAALSTATRMIAEGRRASVAAILAAARLEGLRAEACPPVQQGEVSRGPVSVRWSVSALPRGRRLAVAAAVPGPEGQRVAAITTLLACDL